MSSIEVTPLVGGTVLLENGPASLEVDRPVVITTLDGATETGGYEEVSSDGERLEATGRYALEDGTVLVVRDRYTPIEADGVRLSRRVEVVTVGRATGIRVGLAAITREGVAGASAWQFLLPGQLYNRNDSDGDGLEDYLGTYEQDMRDDKNAALVALAHLPHSRVSYSVARTSLPQHDSLVTEDQLRARHFVQRTDIGSLGLRPDGDQVRLRAVYPFEEEHTFALDTAGTGWSAFAPNTAGTLVDVEYEFTIAGDVDLTAAMRRTIQRQRRRLRTRRPDPGVSLAEAITYRQRLTHAYYRKWDAAENPKEPAGYLVHFSPRDGRTLGSLLEYGFSGDQTLLAFTQLNWGYRTRTPLIRDRARSVIDFFIRHCIGTNGMPHGIYDPVEDAFKHWFTGILMPFQYAEDEADTRRYVGSQIADALLPIARRLREIQGNYLRTMCESFLPILLAADLDLAQGRPQAAWVEGAVRFGTFLLDRQQPDGSWYRAYDLDGRPLTDPASWFGASPREQRSGTIFPIPTLVALHRATGDERYLQAAVRAGDFLLKEYVGPQIYVGGLNDTTHLKSVKTDSVGVMFLMRSLVVLGRTTGERRFLDGARRAATMLCSFVYLWDVPMPPGSLLAATGFQSTGWASCDVIASGAYLDNEFLEFTGDLVDVSAATNDEDLLDIAELVEYGMQHALSTPDNDHGYVAPGVQTEGVLTAYWLSAPDESAFSGAVNKKKGDDNDTANALTNGQAAFGVYQILDRYGTDDFDELRRLIFRDRR